MLNFGASKPRVKGGAPLDPHLGLPDRDPHVQRPSWTETPLDRDSLDRDPSRQRPPWTETPSHATCDACWDRDPPVNRMTHRCKNITLPQTSFVDGNNKKKHTKGPFNVLKKVKVKTAVSRNVLFLRLTWQQIK